MLYTTTQSQACFWGCKTIPKIATSAIKCWEAIFASYRSRLLCSLPLSPPLLTTTAASIVFCQVNANVCYSPQNTFLNKTKVKIFLYLTIFSVEHKGAFIVYIYIQEVKANCGRTFGAIYHRVSSIQVKVKERDSYV